jgi:hypothetical protein
LTSCAEDVFLGANNVIDLFANVIGVVVYEKYKLVFG